MTFKEVLAHVIDWLQQDQRISYRALKRQFALVVGQTTHLAARMEQMAMPGSILLTQATLSLADGYVQVTPLAPCRSRALSCR
jgi:class 3 adenylate cyclase